MIFILFEKAFCDFLIVICSNLGFISHRVSTSHNTSVTHCRRQTTRQTDRPCHKANR